jgi:hypothetical protein
MSTVKKALGLGLDEDSFESCCDCELRELGRWFWIGLGFTIIPLTGFITFFVGVGRYHSAKSNAPDLDFASPPATIIAFHWLFLLCAGALGGIFMYWSVKGMYYLPKLVTVLISIAFVVFYTLYLVFYFRSTEFDASSTFWSAAEYESVREQWRQSQPQVYFTGEVRSLLTTCTLQSPIVLRGEGAADASDFPNFTEWQTTPMFLIKPQVLPDWAPGVPALIQQTRDIIMECRAAREDYLTVEVRVDGFVPAAFVSQNGGTPSRLRKATAVASGIFWAGVLYAYDVDSVPAVNIDIVKSHAIISSSQLPTCNDVSAPCISKD